MVNESINMFKSITIGKIEFELNWKSSYGEENLDISHHLNNGEETSTINSITLNGNEAKHLYNFLKCIMENES